MKYIDKIGKPRQEALNRYVCHARNVFANTYRVDESKSLNQFIIVIFEQFLIRLSTQQVMSLMLNTISIDFYTLNIDQEEDRHTVYNAISNILVGINWPRTFINEYEFCELMWLIQSQAKRSGLIVVDHSGDEVDVSRESLDTALKEILGL
jgi:hypothetical protein